jgi:hypothetical protein
MDNDARYAALTDRSIALIAQEAPAEDREGFLRALIRKAQEEIDATSALSADYIVHLTHERLGARRVGLSGDNAPPPGADLIEVAVTLIERATLKAAGDSIQSDSYDSAAEYSAAVERRSRTFQVVAIERPGDAERWHVRGKHRGESFEQDVMVSGPNDAEFQARWGDSALRSGPVTRDNAVEYLSKLLEIEILDVTPNPVTLHELYESVVAAFGQGTDPTRWNTHITDADGFDLLKQRMSKLAKLFPDASVEGAL